MNVFAFFDFINVFLAVFLCALIYFRDPSGKLSKYFLIITLVSIYCALCEFFRLIANDFGGAIFWHKASFLWPFLPFLFYLFILVQQKVNYTQTKGFNFLIFLPGLLIAALHFFTNILYIEIIHQWYGWDYSDA